MVANCPHIKSEVVIPHGDTLVVARICTSCFAALPANWGCQECEWMEEYEFGQLEPITIVCTYCDDHRYLGGL